jgi:hypothetical protein
VNLYIPSSLGWKQDSAQVALRQTGNYPEDSQIRLDLTLSQPKEFALYLRIPGWAETASVLVNGKKVSGPVVPGTFAELRREWRTGDRVELELPLKLRLEPLDSRHADLAAVLSGPLVLFAIREKAPAALTRQQLLAAKKTGTSRWQTETASGPVTLRPFTAIEEERYSTYLRVS